jgi:hypothetical protein
MRVGFDLDGVLSTQSLAVLAVLSHVKGLGFAKEWYYRECELKMDAKQFLAKEDTPVIVTARESIPGIVRITEEWVERHIGAGIPIIWLSMGSKLPPPISLGGTVGSKRALRVLDAMAAKKAEVINREGIEVYFDDSEYLVKKLRKMCPNCKIIHYGARV